MNKTILIFILLIPLFSFGQVKTEKKYFNEYKMISDSLFADSYSLYIYSDTISKRGEVKSYSMNGKLKSDCYYSNIKNEKKEGVSEYFYDNEKLKYRCYYLNDSLDGEFKTYYPSGEIKRIENYSRGKFLYGKCFTKSGADTSYYAYEIMPTYKGGENALFKYIVSNTKYPKKARKKGVEGTVYVTFVIDKTGKVVKVNIIRGVDPLLDEEALRVVNSLDDWIPGFQDGEKVSVRFNLPIKFRLK